VPLGRTRGPTFHRSGNVDAPILRIDGLRHSFFIPKTVVVGGQWSVRIAGCPPIAVPHFPTERKCGPPSITVSALSRDTWTSEGLAFPFIEILFLFSAHQPRPASRILRWIFSVPPAIYSVTQLPIMIRCSDSRLSGRQGAPISPTVIYLCTR